MSACGLAWRGCAPLPYVPPQAMQPVSHPAQRVRLGDSELVLVLDSATKVGQRGQRGGACGRFQSGSQEEGVQGRGTRGKREWCVRKMDEGGHRGGDLGRGREEAWHEGGA